MKHLLIIFSLLLTSVSWSKTIDGDKLVIKFGLYYEKFTDKPFTGKVTGIRKGKISKGKIKGKWKEYWKNGILKESFTIKKDKMHGEHLSYDETGKLKQVYVYNDGKIIKKFNYFVFYPDNESPNNNFFKGKPKEMGYMRNNKKNGDWIYYGKYGEIDLEGSYIDGLKDGVWLNYHTKRHITEIDEDDIGKLFADDSNELFSKSNYKDGKRDGEYFIYRKGDVFQKKTFQDGKENGEFIVYWSNEKIDIKGNMKDDKLHGDVFKYNEDGALYTQCTYKNGKLNGDVFFYTEGKLGAKGFYENGKKSGDWKIYDNSGNEKTVIKGKDWQEIIDERFKNSSQPKYPRPIPLCTIETYD